MVAGDDEHPEIVLRQHEQLPMRPRGLGLRPRQHRPGQCQGALRGAGALDGDGSCRPASEGGGYQRPLCLPRRAAAAQRSKGSRVGPPGADQRRGPARAGADPSLVRPSASGGLVFPAGSPGRPSPSPRALPRRPRSHSPRAVRGSVRHRARVSLAARRTPSRTRSPVPSGRNTPSLAALTLSQRPAAPSLRFAVVARPGR